MQIKTIGIDLAKKVLQAHAVDERGKTVLRKQFKRDQLAPFEDPWALHHRSLTLSIPIVDLAPHQRMRKNLWGLAGQFGDVPFIR